MKGNINLEPMENLGYYNGKYDEIENMSIPMNDRVCYFGDGVYDATSSRNYTIFALDEHIDRIYNSVPVCGQFGSDRSREVCRSRKAGGGSYLR